MAPISTKARIGAALAAIVLAAGIVACSDNDDRYDHCDDYSCGDGLFLAPLIIPVYGTYGSPDYRAPRTIYPNQPGYKPTYIGKPPNFKPPAGAKINPPGAKPPTGYKPPTGATLTVQKAPQKSGNTKPPSSGGSSSGGGKQTVQKAPSKPSSGGSKSSGGKR